MGVNFTARSASRRTDRKRRRAVDVRLHFESVLLELCATFGKLPADRVDHEIETWLARLAELLRVDRSSLWELTEDGETVHRRHFYSEPDLPAADEDVKSGRYPWLADQYRLGKIVIWSRIP